MTKYRRILDQHQQVEVSIDSETGETMLLYGTDRELRLDPEQALELFHFLGAHEDDIRVQQKRRAHEISFWMDDGFHPSARCNCFVCRYIRCDDGDEEFDKHFPDRDHQQFDDRLVALDLHYNC